MNKLNPFNEFGMEWNRMGCWPWGGIERMVVYSGRRLYFACGSRII